MSFGENSELIISCIGEKRVGEDGWTMESVRNGCGGGGGSGRGDVEEI